jgi:hypothetical protein
VRGVGDLGERVGIAERHVVDGEARRRQLPVATASAAAARVPADRCRGVASTALRRGASARSSGER